MSDKSVFAALFLPLFALLLLSTQFIIGAGLTSRLQRFHPKLYREMGEPRWFDINDRQRARRLWRFVEKREHRHLNDTTLSRLSDALGVLFFVGVIGIIAATNLLN